MSQFQLTAVAAAALSDAASAEHTARDRWVKAGKALAKAGMTSIMLVKATEKHPNDAFNAEALDAVRAAVIQGVSASKKSMQFSTAIPGTVNAENIKGQTKWTVADLLGLRTDQLREIDDDVLKTQRRVFMQLIDGPMMSRVRDYIDRANGIEKKREKTETKTETKTESADPIVIIQGYINQATKMVDVADVDRFQNAGLEMIALIRKMRK
jgi:hypothetical protein